MKKILVFLCFMVLILSVSKKSFAEQAKGKLFVGWYSYAGSFVSHVNDNRFIGTNPLSISDSFSGGKDYDNDVGYYYSNNLSFSLGILGYNAQGNYSTRIQDVTLPAAYYTLSGNTSLSSTGFMPRFVYRFNTTSREWFFWYSLGFGFNQIEYKNTVTQYDWTFGGVSAPIGTYSILPITGSLSTTNLRFGGDWKISKYFYLIMACEYQVGSTELNYTWFKFNTLGSLTSNGTDKAKIDFGRTGFLTGLRFVFGGIKNSTDDNVTKTNDKATKVDSILSK